MTVRRLSVYTRSLQQLEEDGVKTISSQELSEYTHINPTQIRRDLSGFGKFGKRGVGYNVDSLVSEIRKILRTSGQHNIALFGAGNLGQAIASSDIFADHGFQIVAMFDVDSDVVGTEVGDLRVRDFGELSEIVAEREIVVGYAIFGPSRVLVLGPESDPSVPTLGPEIARELKRGQQRATVRPVGIAHVET